MCVDVMVLSSGRDTVMGLVVTHLLCRVVVSMAKKLPVATVSATAVRVETWAGGPSGDSEAAVTLILSLLHLETLGSRLSYS